MGQRSLDLPNGKAGLVSPGPAVAFQAFQVSSETVLWPHQPLLQSCDRVRERDRKDDFEPRVSFHR
jgi:hypothetical protein